MRCAYETQMDNPWQVCLNRANDKRMIGASIESMVCNRELMRSRPEDQLCIIRGCLAHMTPTLQPMLRHLHAILRWRSMSAVARKPSASTFNIVVSPVMRLA